MTVTPVAPSSADADPPASRAPRRRRRGSTCCSPVRAPPTIPAPALPSREPAHEMTTQRRSRITMTTQPTDPHRAGRNPTRTRSRRDNPTAPPRPTVRRSPTTRAERRGPRRRRATARPQVMRHRRPRRSRSMPRDAAALLAALAALALDSPGTDRDAGRARSRIHRGSARGHDRCRTDRPFVAHHFADRSRDRPRRPRERDRRHCGDHRCRRALPANGATDPAAALASAAASTSTSIAPAADAALAALPRHHPPHHLPARPPARPHQVHHRSRPTRGPAATGIASTLPRRAPAPRSPLRVRSAPRRAQSGNSHCRDEPDYAGDHRGAADDHHRRRRRSGPGDPRRGERADQSRGDPDRHRERLPRARHQHVGHHRVAQVTNTSAALPPPPAEQLVSVLTPLASTTNGTYTLQPRAEAAGARPGRDARRHERRRAPRVDPRRPRRLGPGDPRRARRAPRPARRREGVQTGRAHRLRRRSRIRHDQSDGDTPPSDQPGAIERRDDRRRDAAQSRRRPHQPRNRSDVVARRARVTIHQEHPMTAIPHHGDTADGDDRQRRRPTRRPRSATRSTRTRSCSCSSRR